MAFEVVIEQDTWVENPRHEDWNDSVFMMAHSRYAFGDSSEPTTVAEIRERLKSRRRFDDEVLPVYMYDHSGITIATTPFSCPWDSGQIGYIYMSKIAMRRAFGVKRITERVRKLARELMVAEIATLDTYLRGDVWVVEIKDTDTNTIVESVGGIYGYAEAEAEGKRLIELKEFNASLDRSLSA